jgi:hypothetical protein
MRLEIAETLVEPIGPPPLPQAQDLTDSSGTIMTDSSGNPLTDSGSGDD